jgi:DNA-directed RNA polymerase subunit RPC12/RpoP
MSVILIGNEKRLTIFYCPSCWAENHVTVEEKETLKTTCNRCGSKVKVSPPYPEFEK